MVPSVRFPLDLIKKTLSVVLVLFWHWLWKFYYFFKHHQNLHHIHQLNPGKKTENLLKTTHIITNNNSYHLLTTTHIINKINARCHRSKPSSSSSHQNRISHSPSLSNFSFLFLKSLSNSTLLSQKSELFLSNLKLLLLVFVVGGAQFCCCG